MPYHTLLLQILLKWHQIFSWKKGFEKAFKKEVVFQPSFNKREGICHAGK